MRYWYLAHEAFGNRRTYTQTQLRELLMQNFEITERYAHKIIAEGNGFFWDTMDHIDHTLPGTVRMRPPYDLSVQFKVKLGFSESRPVEEIKSKDLKKIYLRFLELFNGQSSSPLSKPTLESLTGISKRVIYLYEAAEGIRKVDQYEAVDFGEDHADACRKFSEGLASGKYKPHKHKVVSMDLRQDIGHGGRQMTVSGIVQRIGSEYPDYPLGKTTNSKRTLLGRSRRRGIWVGNHLLPGLKGECPVFHPL